MLSIWAFVLVLPVYIFAAVWWRQWKRAIIVSLTFLVCGPLGFLAIGAGNYIHFALMYPLFQSKVITSGEPFIRFPWWTPASHADRSTGVIYDRTGRLARATGWDAQDHPHIVGNFYLFYE